MVNLGSIHVGHALGARHHKNIAKRDSCQTGGFITAPAQGAEVDVNQNVKFAWDSSCLNTSAVDIYLYAPYESSTLVQMFQNVDYSKGELETSLKPKWWNSTESIQLELTILNSGDRIWQSTLPAGPIWTAKYDESSAASSTESGTTSSSDTNVTKIDNLINAIKSMPKGAIAAAVLLPLLAIACGVAFWIRRQRKKEDNRRRTYHEKVDQRMSVVSQDWRSITTKGHTASVRASVYGTAANRSSVWSAGAGMAGVGYGLQGVRRASSTYAVEADDGEQPDMSQIRRPGVGLRGPVPSSGSTTRVSRISFAADTRFSRASSGAGLDSATARPRPSGESRRTGVASRAFHSAYIPPVPARPSQYVLDDESGSDDGAAVGAMSPTQRNGPLDLSVDDISAHLSTYGTNESRPSMDGILPALAMMRTNNSSQSDLLYNSQPERETQQHSTFTAPTMFMPEPEPAIPEPAAKSPPMMGSPSIPMPMPMTMSPDEMLRHYAAQRRMTSSSIASPISRMASPPMSPMITSPAINVVTGLAYPMPVANPSAMPTEMRQLFASPPPQLPAMEELTRQSTGDNNPFRKSVARYGSGDSHGTAL